MDQLILREGIDYIIVDGTPLQQSSTAPAADLPILYQVSLRGDVDYFYGDLVCPGMQHQSTDFDSVCANRYQTILIWTKQGLAIKRKDVPTGSTYTYSIEDATKSLELLTFELPDADVELVDQCLIPPLETFTCFGRLPIELRLMIWTLALPGRRLVELAISQSHGCYTISCPLCPKSYAERPREAKPPVTLSVNKESRTLTLEKYYVILQKDVGHYKSRRRRGYKAYHERPLIINPEIDQVWIDNLSIFDPPRRFQPSYGQVPECFDSIKSLELRHLRWDLLIDPWEGQSFIDVFNNNRGGILDSFKYLKDIHLVSPKGLSRGSMVRNFDDIRTTLEHTMISDLEGPMQKAIFPDRHVEMHPRTVIRRVVFYSWRRLQVRSDEEQENDALVTETSTE